MVLYCLTQKLIDVPVGDSWLSEGEAVRLSEMKFPKRRNDWRLGRWTAKGVISSYLNRIGENYPCSALEVRAASDGAPEVYLENERLPVNISLSHSMGQGFCALSPDEIDLGCDLESLEDREREFLLDYFAEEEVALTESLPADERPLCLTLIWSAKESALKSLREGLRRDTRSVVVSFEMSQTPDEWNQLNVRCTVSNRTFRGWWRTHDRYVQTITAGGPSKKPVELQPPN
jgi:4'-phosphopantetheinyl transferase